MTIDMHSHWRPPVLIEALRARKTPPHIVTDDKGVEVLRSGRGDEPVAEAFDDLNERLRVMDQRGVSTAVLSLFGGFSWIERLPVEESRPLVRLINDSVAEICAAHPGRFVAYAALPLADLDAAVAEFERVMALTGFIGMQVPGNAFMTYGDAEEYRPLLDVANKHKAVVFIHWGPRPGDTWPRVPGGTDNMSYRIGTLDMQASLSANMMTLCFTDFLDPYPDLCMHLHNLGGNMPYELERLDHRSLLDTPDNPIPSSRVVKPNVYVDCNSFGAGAIEMGVRAYGADKIVVGTDGTDFGCEWTANALAEANIDEADRDAIRYGNAARMLSHLAPLAPAQQAAE